MDANKSRAAIHTQLQRELQNGALSYAAEIASSSFLVSVERFASPCRERCWKRRELGGVPASCHVAPAPTTSFRAVNASHMASVLDAVRLFAKQPRFAAAT